MFNVAPYIAKYVRSLHALNDQLTLPYSHTQFGVVLMVDVVDFSRLTSQATEKGQSGAEAIALEIGAYLGECIRIVEIYGGDVVKFLGDAVLVSFQPKLSDSKMTDDTSESDIIINRDGEGTADGTNTTAKELTMRQKSVLVRRAIECGQQLLARLSHYQVYLTAEEREKHRTATGEIDRQQARAVKAQRVVLFDGQSSGSSTGTNSVTLQYPSTGPSTPTGPDSISITEYPEDYSMAFDAWSCMPLLRRRDKGNKRRTRVHAHHPSDTVNTMNSSTDDNRNVVDLELHIAMSCGDVTNVVIGELSAPTENNRNNRSKKHGLLPYSTSLNNRKSERYPTFSTTEGMTTDNKNILEYEGRLEYAICGPAVEQLEDALSAAKAGEMSITSEVHGLVQNQALDYVYEKHKRIYIVRRREHEDYNKRIARPNTLTAGHLANRPELKRQGSKVSVEPLIPRTRHKENLELSNDSNPNYFKYINHSALYRLQHSQDGSFPAQFRDVTIMFVSLGRLNVATTKGLHIAQKAVECAIRVLVKYEGMIQQFAVDDKGPTILAVFGLPPLSHEREAVFAAKAAVELRDAYRQFELSNFAIALSTGTIFNAVLPQANPYRQDPSICGDTIVLAVRMLKFTFAKKNVVCDAATRQQIGGLCDFEDMGENFVKGKVKPVQMYCIKKFEQPGRPKRISRQEYNEGGDSNSNSNSDFIGYKSEMDRATQLIVDWNEAENHHMMVISGPSGAGKSFFCHALNKMLSIEDVLTCWSSSAEVERSSKYYLIKSPLLSLLDLIDSDKVAENQRFQGVGTHMPGSPIPLTPTAGDRTSIMSQLSSVSNRESLRQIDSYSSAHRTNVPAGNEPNNDLVELLHRCLIKCGEDESLLPLFRAVFLSLGDIRENKYIALLDGRARNILLIGVITRMVRYVSEQIGVVFICDDVQWADPASIRVLRCIHEQCQRVMIIMATRPTRDYNVGFLKDFYKLGSHEEISLNGLGADEIGEVILYAFKGRVSRVNPEIVRVFQKRTGGNPLYVKNMALVLKDFNNHVTVMDGELVASSSEFDLEDLLVNFDYKRIIMMQFDRLEASFQEFLTVASCLDQYFTMEEVAAVINHNNRIFQDNEMEDILNLIHFYDIYQFLQKVDSPGLHEEMTVYTFTHITIPESIYSMVPYETRVILHRLLAKDYESRLNRDNFSELLPKVTRHYMKTDALGKQLCYLELLADINMKSYFLPEATDNLKAIVNILNDNEAIAEHYGRIHLSDIYRRLGICYTMRTKLNEGEEYLFLSLDALGEPWPRTEFEFLFKLYKNQLIQYHHRRFGPLTRYTSSTKRLVWCRVVDIMVQLSNIYFYKGKGRAFVYTCLVGLNACERLGDCSPNSYNLFLTRNSLLCWINDQKDHSIFYITKALEQHPTDKGDPGTLTTCAMLCFAAGKFANAREHLNKSIQAVEAFGVITDCQAFYRSVGLMITMRIFEGTYNNSPDDMMLLKRMADTAHMNGDSEAEIWLGVYNAASAIIMDRLFDCEAYVAMLEAHARNAADYNKIAIHGTLVCYYARLSNFAYAKQHLKHLVNILPSLTVTPNIFPIFGLIFATMGMYRMIEDAEVDLIPAEDKRSYDQFNLGVSRINHAFQQVKFWEFTQPCLYLARALPYISTGRTVEGYLVLRHGIFEMHFIQEITFLKAYYWANLGKYAFTPTDRIEWTERAQIDLDRLEIPVHVYCNPDPANCYSRNHKADLRS